MIYLFSCKNVKDKKQYWEDFKKQLKPGDEISFKKIERFGFGLLDLQDKLTFCKENNISLYDESYGLTLNSERELAMFYFTLSLKNEDHREKQLRGIKDALRLKEEGKGAYGRPIAELPKDFEEKIITLKREHRPLEAYRKATGMKKSTFYKYAKIILSKYQDDDEDDD